MPVTRLQLSWKSRQPNALDNVFCMSRDVFRLTSSCWMSIVYKCVAGNVSLEDLEVKPDALVCCAKLHAKHLDIN